MARERERHLDGLSFDAKIVAGPTPAPRTESEHKLPDRRSECVEQHQPVLERPARECAKVLRLDADTTKGEVYPYAFFPPTANQAEQSTAKPTCLPQRAGAGVEARTGRDGSVGRHAHLDCERSRRAPSLAHAGPGWRTAYPEAQKVARGTGVQGRLFWIRTVRPARGRRGIRASRAALLADCVSATRLEPTQP